MKRSLLITGITGLIGGSVLRTILALDDSYEITALVRPGTSKSRYAEFETKVEIVELDLADTKGINSWLEGRTFDVVMHIGALRGGRKFGKNTYLKANLHSTQALCEYCLKTGAQLLFCSSVGVFGAIPKELPAQNLSPRNADNYYHYTKIQSENYIQQSVLRGLKAAILRPAITYGPGDNGFPQTLVKMVEKLTFPLIKKRIWIHLCHIQLITDAFVWLLQNDWESGLALNVADREPVQLSALVNFIYRERYGKNYPALLQVDERWFKLGERVARFFRNELWISRFELISKSWFYQVSDTFELMELEPIYTIPGFKILLRNKEKR